MPQLQETMVSLKAEQEKFKIAHDSARQAMKDIVTYVHKAAYRPVKSTLIKAINAYFFTTWPGITANLVEKYFEK